MYFAPRAGARNLQNRAQGGVEYVHRLGGDAKSGMNDKGKGKVDKMPSVPALSTDSFGSYGKGFDDTGPHQVGHGP